VTEERRLKLQEQAEAQKNLDEMKAEREKKLEETKNVIETKKETVEEAASN